MTNTTAPATYTYEIIDIDNLKARDLAEEAQKPADSDCIAATVTIIGEPERAEVLWYSSAGRGGFAWGAPADWTDADSLEDVIERALGIGDKEMAE